MVVSVSVSSLKIMVVIGSLQSRSVSRVVSLHLASLLREWGCAVDVLDLRDEPLPLFNPEVSKSLPEFEPLRQRVASADVFVLASPDYHGGPSGAIKNFLDYFWHEFTGKLFGTLVASHEKGLTVTEQLRTAIRQCYGWNLPYGLSFAEKSDVKDGLIINDALKERVRMMGRDLRVYGGILATQRDADLHCDDHCFMARHRK